MDISKAKKDALLFLRELLEEPLPSETRQDELLDALELILPDKNFTLYIYHSDAFINENGSFDYEELLKKCFDDYEPNVIAL